MTELARAAGQATFGQVVVGPPGSGKTTYCHGLQQFYGLMGRRAAVVNLDPANDAPAYECAVDIAELISLKAVQEELGLGPNGGLIYAMDFLEQNLDWLQERLAPHLAKGCYLLFDLPGQVELFTLHGALKRILDTMTRKWGFRLAAVQLVDAHLCSDPAKYLSALLLSLQTMLHLEMPQVNVLSKFDLIEQYGELAFSLDFYMQAQGLEHLAEAMEGNFPPRFARLTHLLCEIIDDFGLVAFHPLAIEDRESVRHVVTLVDKSNGYVFAGLAQPGAPPPEMQYTAGVGEDPQDLWERMEERYMIGRSLEVRERARPEPRPPPGGPSTPVAQEGEGDGPTREQPQQAGQQHERPPERHQQAERQGQLPAARAGEDG